MMGQLLPLTGPLLGIQYFMQTGIVQLQRTVEQSWLSQVSRVQVYIFLLEKIMLKPMIKPMPKTKLVIGSNDFIAMCDGKFCFNLELSLKNIYLCMMLQM